MIAMYISILEYGFDDNERVESSGIENWSIHWRPPIATPYNNQAVSEPGCGPSQRLPWSLRHLFECRHLDAVHGNWLPRYICTSAMVTKELPYYLPWKCARSGNKWHLQQQGQTNLFEFTSCNEYPFLKNYDRSIDPGFVIQKVNQDGAEYYDCLITYQ